MSVAAAATSRLSSHRYAPTVSPYSVFRTNEHPPALPKLYLRSPDHDPTTYKGAATNFAATCLNIRLQKLNFFQPQPTHKRPLLAPILLLSFHNWSDEQAVRILQVLVPTMRANPEARALLYETAMPKPGQINPLWKQRLRPWNLAMLVVVNTRHLGGSGAADYPERAFGAARGQE